MRTFKKSLITAAVLTLTAGLLCACSGSHVLPFVPATRTDEKSGATATDGTDSTTNWTVARDACTHAFEPYASAAATCVADGYEILRCSLCGETQITTTQAQGHLFAPDADSTATDAVQYRCSHAGCSAVYTETGAEMQSALAYALPTDGSDAVTYDPAGQTPGADYVPLPLGFTTWGYQSLSSAAQRRFYAAAMQGLLSFAETDGDLPAENEKAVCLSLDYAAYDLSDAQARTVLTYVTEDSPLLFWLDDTVVCENGTAVLYVRDAYRDPAQRRAVAVQLAALVQTVSGNDAVVQKQMEGAADFDLAVAAYRAVKACLTLTEQNDGVADTAAGALTGKCTSLGYARLYTIVCNRLGIPCITARGAADGEGCNRIYLAGAWYAADAAADDADGADWLRCFGTVTADASSGEYPLPTLAAVAVGPVTLSNQNGDVGRYISVTAAFDAMTDTSARYVITPDADLATDDTTVTDPFAWSFTLPSGSWPRAGSLTIAGAVAANDVLGSVGLPLQMAGNPVLSCPVTFQNTVPQSSGLLILVGATVTFSGENASLAVSVGGDETTGVTFDYSGRFTYTGRCQVGTVNIYGSSPVVEGIIYVRTLTLGRRTHLELQGDYLVNAQTLGPGENSALVLTDRVAGQGTLYIGALAQTADALNVRVRILSSENYPDITFADRVTVPVTFALEGTSVLQNAIAPGKFDGVLYTLSGGTPVNWTLTVDGIDVTGQTTRDAAGRYRFVTM